MWPGPRLRQLLDGGPLAAAQACSLLADVADAVDAAHRAGVIHRDLKPSNILLDESMQPHVCDFGLALQESRQQECRGECAGTLAYMAPEQLRGESHQLDGRADIWAAGVILYEVLTGRQPFRGHDRQELTEDILARDPRPPRQIDRRIGKAVERVCLRCLEKRPAHRYPTAADLAEELRRAACRPSRSGRGWLFGGAVLAVLLFGPGWLPVTGMRPTEGPLPLQGTLDLMVWNPTQSQRQGVQLGDQRAVPLRTGDRVRLAVELNRPAYAYVVWLDAAGMPAPVYPWQRGDWANLPPMLPAAAALALPGGNGGRLAGPRAPRTGWKPCCCWCAARRSPPRPICVPCWRTSRRRPFPRVPTLYGFREDTCCRPRAGRRSTRPASRCGTRSSIRPWPSTTRC